ncbi:hypothetical protein JCGZ_02244 [Jatropha curcas]|uniref:Calcium-transporting ATPase n=1 Tax=Jatropha curcas TaxID=180498 RepID=A0A067KVP2_JATCU|nr:hypothetical protein JCGZ_02244 [Jatropha curcas]
MSIFLQTRFEYLFDVPSTSSQPNKKRWHLAFATIYCARAINSLTKIPISNKISRSPSFIAVNVRPDNSTFTINQTTLVQLVKEKNYKQLRQLGGVAGVASAAETHLEGGIHGDVDDIARRQEAFGSNTYKKPPTKNFFHFVIEAFKDITIAILLGCAALSLGFGIKEHGLKEGWYDGGSIFVAVFLVIAVSAVSNYRQNRQFDKLSKISNNIQIDVMRSGRRQQVSIFELVVGDVVCLKIGDQVPADGLFIDGHSLQIDESSMTGESDHVEINHDQNPFLVSGTKVADGYGSMLITSVGMNTTWGEMMSHISRDTDEQTPLQARLNKLTSSIGKVGLAVAFLVLLVLLVRYFTGNTQDENGNREFNGSRTKADDIVNAVVGIVAAAVTIVVVAIPEGLPLAVTLTLAYSMKRMMADQAMVRKLSACETMGSATTICTDKTGTLTMNLMKVTKFFLGQGPTEQSNTSSISPYVIELVKQGVALNTTGSAYRANTESEYEFSGSPTEKAILSWASMDLKMDIEEQKHSFVVLHVEAFNSHKKRSGVLVRKKLDNTIHVHWKGAAEMILAMCSSYYDASGIMKDLDDHQRNVFKQIIQGMAADSLRCIAFAHTHISEERHQDGKEEKKLKETGLTLLGLVGIKDPCRPGVKKAVDDCQHAGVNIKMITGDNVFTARAIAIECGILKPGQDMFSGAVVEGEEFRNYTPEERMEKVDKICVMARSSPFDKLLMVQCLKQKGHVVAVTGDGTNDAPALKEADIGLSMGIQGTEVAKESSDIVILDDNFADGTFNCHMINMLVFNEFNARKLEKKNVFKGIHKNKLFLGIIGITIVLQVLMVEFLRKFADTERLNWGQWGLCIGVAALSWPIGWAVKYIPVPEKPIFSYFNWKK